MDFMTLLTGMLETVETVMLLVTLYFFDRGHPGEKEEG